MYENMSYEIILERMLDRIPNTLDKRESSPIYNGIAPAAMELMGMYLELELILQETFGDTASREFLIRRAKERGIEPYPATKSLLKGIFTPIEINIPIGSRFSLNDLNYTIESKISEGEYTLECEETGVKGNQYSGDLIPVEYIEGLETAKITELLIPGEDEEDTEDFRRKYFKSFNAENYGGNQDDYLQKTNSIAGVGATKVTRAWNLDIKPSNMIPTQGVTTWYESIISTLDEEVSIWLSTVYMAALERKLTVGGTVKLNILNSEFNKASNTLIDKVQGIIDPTQNVGEGLGVAPMGHVVKVDTVEEVNINISTSIIFEDGKNFTQLETEIKATLEDYLLELRKEWSSQQYLIVRISQIETRILNIPGIIDINGTKINNTPSNLDLTKYQIPIFGGVLNE